MQLEQLKKMEARYDELEQLLGTPEIATDKEKYNRLAKELSDLAEPVSMFRLYKNADLQINDLEIVLKEKHEKDFLELVEKELEDLKVKKSELKASIKKALTGEDKDLNVDIIVEIRQGTGGDEAALFAGDLFRMYTLYAAKKGWSVEAMATSPRELGGFKEVVFSVHGRDAYKRLKFESGVHRVQRVPETESQGRVHTSTATVVVMAEPKEVDTVVEQKDLKIETYRSSGAGGQHMQKTDSAVRITHIPSGLVVACQDERSQLKNKNKGLRILSARLLDMKREEETKKMSQARRSQIGTGDRSEKIRTYNFPDRRVTDHRINVTLHQLEAILDGDMDELSDALIKAQEDKAREASLQNE